MRPNALLCAASLIALTLGCQQAENVPGSPNKPAWPQLVAPHVNSIDELRLRLSEGRRWALIVGANRYQHWPRLETPVADARGFQRVLVERYGFARSDVLYLIDEPKPGERVDGPPTQRAIATALKRLFGDKQRVKRHDLFVFFFAGHAYTREGTHGAEGFLVPADASTALALADLEFLPMRKLRDMAMQVIPARHSLFVVDACLGGLLAQRRLLHSTPRYDLDSLARAALGTSRCVLAAGSKGEHLAGHPGSGQSCFAHALCDGLESGKADLSRDGLVTAAELYLCAERGANRLLAAQGQAEVVQTPQLARFGGDGEFAMDAVPKADSAAPSLGDALRQLLRVPAPHSAIDHMSLGLPRFEPIDLDAPAAQLDPQIPLPPTPGALAGAIALLSGGHTREGLAQLGALSQGRTPDAPRALLVKVAYLLNIHCVTDAQDVAAALLADYPKSAEAAAAAGIVYERYGMIARSRNTPKEELPVWEVFLEGSPTSPYVREAKEFVERVRAKVAGDYQRRVSVMGAMAAKELKRDRAFKAREYYYEGAQTAREARNEGFSVNDAELIAVGEKLGLLLTGGQREKLRQALYAGSGGDYAREIKLCNEVLAKAPGAALAYRLRGQAYLKSGFREKGFADLERALECSPDQAFSLEVKGKIAVEKHQFKKALALYQQAAERDPKNLFARLNLAALYKAQRQWSRTMHEYNAAIELDPNFAAAYGSRSTAFLDQGDVASAINDLTRAVEVDPGCKWAYASRGDVFSDQHHYDRAIEDFTAAIKIDPKYVWAYNSRGLAYYYKRDYARAVADLTEAISLDPKYKWAYTNRGDAYAKMGRLDAAIADYSRAIELAPKDDWAYYRRACVLEKTRQIAKAIADYQRAAQIDPKGDTAASARKALRRLKSR